MLPNGYLDRLKDLLGDEYEPFLNHYNQPPSIGLRVNTLKLSPDQFDSISPYPLTPLPWTSSGFTIPTGSRPGKHPYHAAGLYYLQDPSAMAVAEYLDPQPGDKVLDLAGAPGGKSTHIAAKLGGQGLLVANDIHPRRVRDLVNNMERWGPQNAVILNETPTRLADHFGAYFDKVLVDAPCSGEGMFRKDTGSRLEWSPKLVESCALRQDGIMWDAAKMVRPGGLLAYSTCTYSPEENEGTVHRFLNEHHDFELKKLPILPGASAGIRGTERGLYTVEMDRTVRFWPHKAPGEGHFIAILQRDSNLSVDSAGPHPIQPNPIPPEALSYWNSFQNTTLKWRPTQNQLEVRGSYVYHLPEFMPEMHGLKVVHWGFWLGTLKIKRFEPSHALAMARKASDFQQVYSLSANDPHTLDYLHGEILPSPGSNGWVLVTVDGFPLGWGKRVHNRLKSHSPKWLRWI